MSRTVVYTYVCGDILHKGHLIYLQNAKRQGDVLVVGVLTDEAIMERKEEPVMPFEERLELVSALKPVDLAVAQKTYSPVENIKLLKPDIVIDSESHDDVLLTEVQDCMKQIGGKVVVLPYYMKQSSTHIKERIRGLSAPR